MTALQEQERAHNRRLRRLPVTPKYCEYCGQELIRKMWPSGAPESPSLYNKRRFCSRRCGQLGKPIRASTPNGHRRAARQLVPPGPCEWCGSPNARDVHHGNGETFDTRIDNLFRICRSCHLTVHKRNWFVNT